MFEKKDVFLHDRQAGWGLKEQTVYEGGEFNIPLPDFFYMNEHGGQAEGVDQPTLDPIRVNRAMECSVYGESPEQSLRYTYVEPVDFDRDAFVSMLENDLSMKPTGTSAYEVPVDLRRERGTFVYMGDDYFIWGSQNATSDSPIHKMDGEFEPADPNEFVSDESKTQSCSMFFARTVNESAGFAAARSQNLTAGEGLETYLTTTRDMSSPGAEYEDVICEEISWVDEPLTTADESVQPKGEPVAQNEICRIYEVDEGWLSECGDEGYGISTGTQELAELILPPKFRGFDGQ